MNAEAADMGLFMKGRFNLYSELSTLFSSVLTYKRVGVLRNLILLYRETFDEKENLIAEKVLTGINTWMDANYGKTDDADFELEMAREHTKYFVLGINKVPDSASSVLSVKNLIKREQWENCRKYYRKHGFNLPAGTGKLEDSLEIQCLFICTMIRKGSSSDITDETLVVQTDFIRNHMLNWLGFFGKKLLEMSDNDSIYNALAMLPYILVKADYECICGLRELL
ncbi:molecular chaperone TorD family protein [Seleniivibrio woodruffii]|uniref:molecular chaperone TorD family protein n=1 Tax=Seleniivibrio woodruffii TaxID=1078050 RepID=UPI0024092397|nr:molecular chaperone TorD family protein [Seleniivibrio woodruffii]